MLRPNRLAGETSPYLRQHADNPVDWHPWGPEALAEAKRRDVPLFVSIGYSACHWCHVMAHESFEDPAIAAVLAEGFVAVKVDREERPDLDALYLEAVQALTGGGGWPLSVFCTPDGRPFFGGTYFPPRDTGHLPSFAAVLRSVTQAWAAQREEVDRQANELTEAVSSRLAGPGAPTKLPTAGTLVAAALERFSALYDPRHGGIGGAPKFPQVPMLELVLRAGAAGDRQALEMVEHTLAQMASGGIYDHLAGGFCRYSVDAAWQVPHFEKMLYDQAMLARLYLHAYQVTGDRRWRQVVEETVGYVLAEMGSPGGGWSASEDADSQEGEGRTATWTVNELRELLGHERAERAARAYGVVRGGNFEGRSVLHRPIGEIERDEELEALRLAMLEARRRRPQPGRDDKVICEWNAMFGATLAEAGLSLDRPEWLAAAREQAQFLLVALRDGEGRWHRSYRDGRTSGLAVAADYAWLVEFFTRLGEATGEAHWIAEAAEVAKGLIERFGAPRGGWYMTGSDAEELVVRPRDTYDGVTPAAGSVAAVALLRLGARLGDEALRDRAMATIEAAGASLGAAPLAMAHLCYAVELAEAGPVELVLPGAHGELLEAVSSRFLPFALLAWGDDDGGPLFSGREPGRAYVCRRNTCLAPLAEPDALIQALGLAPR
ncbi:MAG: thioredoxin domain-containing protein [Actinomycetota bacterium]|nr:thioredoxin domain-containing protein [Actinomycetota bacterium]